MARKIYMFDTKIYKTETKVTPITQVIEKTITPDKVTDMYDKVREEVEKSVVQIIKIESNTLNGVVVEMVNEYDTASRNIFTRFILNGEEHLDKRVLLDSDEVNNDRAWNMLVEHYQKVVGLTLLKENALFGLSKIKPPNNYERTK